MNYPYPFQTQIHPENGSGQDDCYQASLAGYLKAKGLLAGLSDDQVLNELSLATRGTPDSPDNPYTSLNQADAGLQHYGLPVTLSYDWADAVAAPWSVCLVDGTVIRRADGTAPYPASWFDGATGPDHFILWGPPFQGAYNWCMNPLDPSGTWAQYDLATLRQAFSCAYLLPSLEARQVHWSALQAFALQATPAATATALAQVPAAGTGIDWGERRSVAGVVYGRLQWRDRVGWAPVQLIQLATA